MHDVRANRRIVGLNNAVTHCLQALVAAAVVFTSGSAYAASRDPVYAENGMVVSASVRASETGVKILESGGNAFDAAAAVGFTLAVTYPQAGNIGGGGFMVAYKVAGDAITLDFREKAPVDAHRDMFLDASKNVIKGLSTNSPLAAGVPGSVDGLLRIWRDHGSGNISRRALLAPAIRLARKGFPVSRNLAASLNRARERFARDPGASEIFIRGDGRPWKAGDKLVQRDLARTLERIADGGRDGFYAGSVADLFAEQQAAQGGMIGRDDLRRYESVYRPAVVGTYRDYDIITMGPPSSGGIVLVHMLNMAERYEIGALGWNSSKSIHLLTEIQRRAYADRAEHLGDPDFWKVPEQRLTSETYADDRIVDIYMDRATPSTEVRAGTVSIRESAETTHYSVVDARGNCVAVTTTLNTGFGSGIVVQGAGFLLNNEMDDFSLKPGVPNTYGLVGGEANAIEPEKRMLSSMTPTVVLRDGRPFLVLGSPGGSTIITTVLQNFLNVVEHGMDIQEAIAAPRHHSQWLPDVIVYEPRAFPADVAERLRAMGHTLRERGSIGQANAILIKSDGLYGAPDPRSDNAAVGH